MNVNDNSTANTAPGWYPDQNGQLRYWNGQTWTNEVPQPIPGQKPQRTVTKTRKKTSHTFHLLMSILTCGVWAVVVWLPITIYNSLRHDKAKSITY